MFFLKKNQYVTLFILAFIGVALTVFTYISFKRLEEENIRINLKEKGEDRISTFQEIIEKSVDEINSLAAFFNASEKVERQEFRSFTQAVLDHHVGLQALEWIPRVTDAERQQHEEDARRDGLPGYRITELKEPGKMVRADVRAEYYPVHYLEPLEENESALGYDLASNPARLAAMELARDSASPVATTRVRLVQEPDEHYAILVLRPVYRKGMPTHNEEARRAALFGFVLGVFRVDEMMERALSFLTPQAIDIILFDEGNNGPVTPFMGLYSSAGEGRFFDSSIDQEKFAEGYHYSKEIRVADRSWQMYCKPAEQFLLRYRTLNTLTVPAVILFFVLLVIAYLLFYFHHAESIKLQAENLARAKSELETEIGERKKAEKERAKLEGELRHANKMEAIGTLAGGIAHDFNNILTIIIGNADIARVLVEKDGPADIKLQKVLSASNRAKNLVNQILSFSRKADGDLRPVSPAGVVRETVKMLRSTIPATVKIEEDLDPQSGTILVGPTGIDQLLINLCTNAVHAMNEKGTLAIGLHRRFLDAKALAHRPDLEPGIYVELSVGDTGAGIDPAIIGRIFDPFFTTKEIGEGTGMGLAMVHGIVTSHRGLVTVESEPGKGTRFRVYFPLAEEVAFVPEKVPAALPTGTEHILLVDDEESIVEIGRHMLEQQGFTVTTRTAPGKALDFFREEPERVDLVITDQAMPEMSGVEMTEAIKRIRPGMPVILCTGYSKKVPSGAEAEKLGMDAFLLKPLDRQVLVSTVRRVLDEKAANVSSHPDDG